MKVIYRRCAGLDVHEKTVYVCARILRGKQLEIIEATFSTMSRFPTAGHLASWCGLCPGNARSAGKRHSGRTSKGNRYVRRALVQTAWAAARINRKRTFFTMLFYRISSRSGMKKAAVAVAHRLLRLIYSMILSGSTYREQGADYFDRLHPERTRKRLTARLERLGFLVTLAPKPLPESS